MTAASVHAVLAAAVNNPALIVLWQDHPESFLRHGIEPASIDLETLRQFAGLAVKVRHNGVRQILPKSFRLMSLFGLEIEIFASYATFTAKKGHGYAATSEQRMRDFIIFFEQWLDLRRKQHALLWDLIRHEQTLAQLTSLNAEPRGAVSQLIVEDSKVKPIKSIVPAVCGSIVLHGMRCDPRALAMLISGSTPDLSKTPLRKRYYCYWLPDSTKEIKVLDLDELGYCLLSLVDGGRTTDELNRALGCGREEARFISKALKRFAEIGIIQI